MNSCSLSEWRRTVGGVGRCQSGGSGGCQSGGGDRHGAAGPEQLGALRAFCTGMPGTDRPSGSALRGADRIVIDRYQSRGESGDASVRVASHTHTHLRRKRAVTTPETCCEAGHGHHTSNEYRGAREKQTWTQRQENPLREATEAARFASSRHRSGIVTHSGPNRSR